MRRLVGCAVALLLSLSFAATSVAVEVDESFTGSKMLKRCSLEQEDTNTAQAISDRSLCLGFLIATAFAMHCKGNGVFGVAGEPGYRSQPPAQATMDQIRRVIVKWLNDHPAELHKPSSILFAQALQETWPCP